MLQPLQQPQEAAHLPPVRDGWEAGTDPTELSRASVHRAGAPGGSGQGLRARWAGTAERGRAGVGAAPARGLAARAPPPPPRLEAVGARCELEEREWRLAVSLIWPLAPASPRGRPGGCALPGRSGLMAGIAVVGKWWSPGPAALAPLFPSETRAEPFPEKHTSCSVPGIPHPVHL